MGKFFYVSMNNAKYFYDEFNKYESTETGKKINNIVTNISLGYSEPSALALLNIKETYKKKEKKRLLGISIQQKVLEYEPFFIICEDLGDYLQEIITGKKYQKKEMMYINEICNSLKLSIVREIPSTKVVEMLKSLSNKDIQRFVIGMKKLDSAILDGYYMDIQRIENNKRQQKENEDYINTFRKRYGNNNKPKG